MRIRKIRRANQANRSESGDSNRTNQIDLYYELSKSIIDSQGESDSRESDKYLFGYPHEQSE